VSRRPSIAIDGPVAAGKSTIARAVAARLGYTYVDTGAMYRALAWAARERNIGPQDAARVVALLDQTQIRLSPRPGGGNEVLVDGRRVTADIRGQDIGQLASQLSEIPAVRRRMVALQREMAKDGGVVMEGRDIQTVVLPDAEVKVFLTASVEERARRRHLELQQRGFESDYESVLREIQERDHRDSTRADSPLRAAPDAVQLDTTGLTQEEVISRVLEIVAQRTAARG
jgi:cytidylate kinase